MAPFKSSRGLNLGKQLKGYRTSTLGFQLRADPPPPVTVTGGTVESGGIQPGNDYQYHVFTTSGSLIITNGNVNADYIIIGGGGGGSGGIGGGGGAGRYRAFTDQPLTEGTYPVTIGDGGTGGPNAGTATVGGNSVFNGLTSQGGGRGGAMPDPFAGSNNNSALNGGSGGGGGRGSSPYNGVTGHGNASPGPGGNRGGTGGASGNPVGNSNHSYAGGGGGGAGGIATNGSMPDSSPAATGGSGGPGTPNPSYAAPLVSPGIPSPERTAFSDAVGPTGLYAGGGGGAAQKQSGNPGTGGDGGPGGGGNGDGPLNPRNNDAVFGTGGGGGGTDQSTGGDGAGGIVIIRVPTSDLG